jgi:hypothetical protein
MVTIVVTLPAEMLTGKDMSDIDRRDEGSIRKSQPGQQRNIVPESPSDIEASSRLDPASMLLAIQVIMQQHWEEKEIPAKAKPYPFPFVVDDEFVRKLNKRAIEGLNRTGILSGNTISVIAEVRFDDLSTSRFTTLDEFLDKAGDRRDPASMMIEWSAVLQEPMTSTAKIQAVFTTEKPSQVTEQWFEFPAARMDLRITGPDRQWIENVFGELDPFFTSVRLGGIYRPLLIFRNRTFVHLFSWLTGFAAQMFYLAIFEWIQRSQVNATRQDHINRIVNQPTVEAKIDSFVREIYGPVKNSPIIETLPITLGGFVLLLFIAILGYMWYPKLVPRAGIKIGLASTRYASYDNTFRLIFVTVITTIMLGGIIMPLIRSWLF